MAYIANTYSECLVKDVKWYLDRGEEQQVAFNTRILEITPFPNSLTMFIFFVSGWTHRVKAIIEFPESEAHAYAGRLTGFATLKTKVRIQGTTNPEHKCIVVKNLTGIVEETLRGKTK